MIIAKNQVMMETSERDKIIDNEIDTQVETDALIPQNIESEDPEELDLGEEIASEKEVNVEKNYSILSQKDLLDELKRLVDSSSIERIRRDVEAIKNVFYRNYRQEQDEQEKISIEEGEPFEPVEDPFEQEFKAYLNKYKNKREGFIQNVENQKEENYKKKLAIIEELKDLTNEEENLNQTFHKFHDLMKRWKETGQVPQNCVKDLWDTWHHNVEKFYDYVKINKELRDLDLKRNLEAKNNLIKKAESLLDSNSVSEAFAQLQTYHDTWREIGPVPREQKDELWERFKEVTLQINKKHQAYFEQLRAERVHNLQMKMDLCERLEELNKIKHKTMREWQKASDELLVILEEWKSIGFVPKKDNAEAYARLKKARDTFFTTRRDFYKILKHETNNNIRLKKELCEQAEALQNNENWKETTELLIALQKQWKQTGPVPRKYSDVLWNRFRVACDSFFNRKAEFFSQKDNSLNNNWQAKESLLTELEQYTPKNPAEAFETLRQFRQRWNEIGFVPIKEKGKIQKRFFALLDSKYSALKVNNTERDNTRTDNMRTDNTRTDNIRSKERVKNSGRKQSYPERSERDKLLKKIIELENEVALLENNIGFFASTKNSESVISDVRKKIDGAQKEIYLLEEQIRLIDKEFE
jgi:hypothetical protein